MDIFYGRVTDNVAHVYVRAARDGPNDARTLTGTIRGPHCALSHTLPATIALRDMGHGPTLLGSATVPDPCFWSPQLPALYDVHVELRDQHEIVQTLDQTIGIRRLGVAGRTFLWEGKRWVLRGVGGPVEGDDQRSIDESVATFREAWAAMHLVDPLEPVCRRASQAGVLVVAQLTDSVDLEGQLAELARSGAVAIAVLPANLITADNGLRNAAPNLLLAQPWRDATAVKAAEWADLVVCKVSEPNSFHRAAANCPLPIVAQRRLNETLPVAAARAACDLLQRDLAPGGDYAGYLVTQP